MRADKITVVGGGNIGTWLAAACSKTGYNVTLFTTHAKSVGDTISVIGDTPELSYSAKIYATDNLAAAVSDCDIVLITYPTNTLAGLAKKLYPLINADTAVGFLPGAYAELAFVDFIKRGNPIFGLQRVPGVARLTDDYNTVRAGGIRAKLHLSAIPSFKSAQYAAFFERVFNIPCDVLNNYLTVTLVPSNAILHTGRLYAMFCDGSKQYKRNILFYEEWNDESSEIVLSMDAELQAVCRSIKLDMSGVVSLRTHYESNNAHEMTNKIRSIKSFKGLTSPMIQSGDYFEPDYNSRYFCADFPYGLCVIEEFGKLARVQTPTIDKVMQWYRKTVDDNCHIDLKDFGILNQATLTEFYSR